MIGKRYNKALFILSVLLFAGGRTSHTVGSAPVQEERPVPQMELQAVPDVESGRPFWPLDLLGNVLSLPKKLLLWNSQIDSHRFSPETQETLETFLDEHVDELDGVKVRLNQWAPLGELKRLKGNDRLEWYYRVFPGIPVTLWSSLTGRLLGGDHYNPYTHTVHLFSDDASVALHEMGHAHDFAGQSSPGLYAVGRILPPLTLHQEQKASETAIRYFQESGDRENELEAYAALYPAFGTYAGDAAGVPYGSYVGAGAGHLLGALKRHERRLGYEALDEAQIKDTVTQDALSHALEVSQEETRLLLFKALTGNGPSETKPHL